MDKASAMSFNSFCCSSDFQLSLPAKVSSQSASFSYARFSSSWSFKISSSIALLLVERKINNIPNITNGITNIPRNNVAICLVKCKERECVERCILTKWLHLFNAKRLSRPSGGSVFLPPDFSGQATFIGWVRKSFRL